MLLPLLLLLQTVAPTPAVPTPIAPETAPLNSVTSGEAQDAVDLFMQRCVIGAINLEQAHQLDADPAHARQMTAQELVETQATTPDSVGWIVHGDRGGWMALTIQPRLRTCMVHVRAAPADSLTAELTKALTRFFVEMIGLPGLTPKHARSEVIDGVVTKTLGWEINPRPQVAVAVFATVLQTPVRGRQAQLTFTILRAH